MSTPLGRITIASEAIAHIVGRDRPRVLRRGRHGAARQWLPERAPQGHRDHARGRRSVTIDLHVVVEYGLNLAEVASSIRNRVSYEVARMTGLPVRAVEVHIDDVRRNA